MRRPLLLLLAAAVLLPGCADPLRVRVDPAVLQRDLKWREQQKPEEWHSPVGPNLAETDYVFDAASCSTQPPYCGEVIVIAVAGGPHDAGRLLSFLRDIVANVSRTRHVDLDAASYDEGSRDLANGLHTRFFTQTGRITQSGALFRQSTLVRVVAETGFDGASRTSILAVAVAQVQATPTCPVLVSCPPRTSLTTWTSVAGDPSGSIAGATSANGLLHHLVTH